jgi:hypothetical protein
MYVHKPSVLQLSESIEIKDVLTLGNHILELEVWPYSDVVSVVYRVISVSWVDHDDVVFVFIGIKVIHWVIVSSNMEEDVIEDNISEKNHASIFIACPPRRERVEGLSILVVVKIIVCNRIHNGDC